MDFRLDGRVALITGAAGGIGSAVSHALAAAGASVVVSDVTERRSDTGAVAAHIEAGGGAAQAATLDVTDPDAAAAVVAEAIARFGSLDVLVNNAVWRRPGPALETTIEDWDRTMAVTLRGTFTCAVAAARVMRPGGRIINIASQLGLVGLRDAAAYTAAKGGVVNLTRSLALEWAEGGITVNAVAPGPIDTPLLRERLRELDQPASIYLDRLPIGRIGTGADVAAAVRFLASEEAGFVTGHTLVVDGGWTAA